MRSDADQLGGMKGCKPVSSADDRLIDTNQTAREGSGIFIRSQKVRDRLTRGAQETQDCAKMLSDRHLPRLLFLDLCTGETSCWTC